MIEILFYILGTQKPLLPRYKKAYLNLSFFCGASDFYYPKFASNHGTIFYQMFSDFPHKYKTNIAQGIDTPEKALEKKKMLTDKVFRELSKLPKEANIVLSGEKMIYMNKREVARLQAFLNELGNIKKVIAYVRDPVGFGVSWVNQCIKNNNSIDKFYQKTPLPHYKKKLSNWMGNDFEFCVKDFNAISKSDEGVLCNFLKEIGFKDVKSVTEVRENESMSYEMAKIVDLVALHRPMVLNGKKNKGRVFQDTNNIFRGIPGSKFTLPIEIIESINEKSKKDREWLNKEFGIKYKDRRPELSQAIWSDETLLQLGLVIYDLYYENHLLKKKLKI